MLGAFSAIELASPAVLLAAAFAPLLIFAYLRRQSRRWQTVSSVLILERLPLRRTLRRRFKPPLRFFVEFAALLALVLAAAGPSCKRQGERVAVLLDNSLSMRAKSIEGEVESSRFEEAKRAVKKWTALQSGRSKYSLFAAAPKLRAVGQEDLDRAGLLAALDQAESSITADTLEGAVKELGRSHIFDKLLVVTDKRPEWLSGNESAASSPSPAIQTKLEVLTVGSSAANIYLSDLRFIPGDAAGQPGKIGAAVKLSGPGEIAFRAALYPQGSGAALHQPAASVSSRAAGGKGGEVFFTLPHQAARHEVFKVDVVAEGAGSAGVDALTEDNVGWVSTAGARTLSALLVSPRGVADTLGLSDIPALQVDAVSAESYAGLSAAQLEQYSLLIFHECAPAAAPRRPTLLIIPPAENPLFSAAGEFSSGKVASWASAHPITSYLRLELVPAAQGVVFDVPPWAQAIINVEQGAIVAAGESEGVRFAGSGIELLPFEGARTPVLSILTLNILNWLAGGAELASGILTGSTVRLEGGKSWSVTKPDGVSEAYSLAPGSSFSYVCEQPGPYRIAQQGEKAEARVITVNSFFPAESTTAEVLPLAIPRTIEQEAVEAEQNQPLWPYLAGLVIVLLLVEPLFLSAKAEVSRS